MTFPPTFQPLAQDSRGRTAFAFFRAERPLPSAARRADGGALACGVQRLYDGRMRELYPAIEPFDAGMLPVSPVHTLYYEQCGNPEGLPVVFLHGGPGGGSIPDYRRYFDPAAYRIVLFDQRGAGRSTPHASLEANTTWHLVADMERLREQLDIERGLVVGGSWGSALALAYAERHPERASALIVRGVFTLRRLELEWYYKAGASLLFPDTWQGFLAPIPVAERDDLIAAYRKRLTHPDRAVQLEAAKAWSVWEGQTIHLVPDPELAKSFAADDFG